MPSFSKDCDGDDANKVVSNALAKDKVTAPMAAARKELIAKYGGGSAQSLSHDII